MQSICPQGHLNAHDARYCAICGLTVGALDQSQVGAERPARPPRDLRTVWNGLRSRFSQFIQRIPRRILFAAAGGFAALVIGIVSWFLLTTAPVPDLTSMSPSDAVSTSTAAGFSVGSQTRDFSDVIAKGQVVAQSPGPGQRLRKGGTIDLVISRGPAVVIPDVVGMGSNSAQTQLSALALSDSTNLVPSETTPLGQVMAQSPRPGTTVEEGSTVELTVSSGPPTVDMTVVLDLFDGYDSCGWSLGYFDIPGADVTIEADGEVVATGSLPYLGSDETLYCEYRTVLTDVPSNASTYSLEISWRGKLTKSRAELEGDDWTWSVSLGL